MRPMASWSNFAGVNVTVLICCVILLSICSDCFVFCCFFYADFVFVLNTALFVVQTCQEFMPAMMSENRGHIVTIASMSAKSGTAFLVDYRCARSLVV